MKTQVYVFPDAVQNASNNSLDITKIRFSDTPYKNIWQKATKEFKQEIFGNDWFWLFAYKFFRR
mgnify:CR=1 FL=1